MTQREFSQFVTKYEKLVFTICYQFVKDYHEAQNLSQETFLSAYRHIDTYQGDNYKPKGLSEQRLFSTGNAGKQ